MERDSAESFMSSYFKSSPRSQRAEQLRSTSLIVIKESSRADTELLQLVCTVLRDFSFGDAGSQRPLFGPINIVLSEFYLQFLLVVI